MNLLNLFFVFILIVFTAFFVASEFAIIRVRVTRINQLIEEKKPGAVAVKTVITHLDEYLSACQLGITIAALGLGWIGEESIEFLLKPVFEIIPLNESVESVISFVIAFSIITFLNVVVGELAPKTLAIQKAETICLFVCRPLIWFYKLLFPFIWLLNSSSRLLIHLIGLEPASEIEVAHSEEELRMILSESYKSGEINQSEYKYVNNIFEFDNRIAKEIMVPRTEMITLEKNATLEEILYTVQEEGYTRYPVTDGDKDNIIGIVNIKELLTDCLLNKCENTQPLEKYLKHVKFVMESFPIQDLLVMLQKDRSHMVILSDEYGGTAGLVTVEDIIEEIVGEIRDEFDEDEIPLIQTIGADHYILDAKLLISEVNDLLNTHLEDDEVDTIGGWILTQKFDLKQGDMIEREGYSFIIKEIDGHHIQYVEVKKINKNHSENIS